MKTVDGGVSYFHTKTTPTGLTSRSFGAHLLGVEKHVDKMMMIMMIILSAEKHVDKMMIMMIIISAEKHADKMMMIMMIIISAEKHVDKMMMMMIMMIIITTTHTTWKC